MKNHWEQRVADLEADLADLIEAKWLSQHGGRAELCGCGALTVSTPCPKCKRQDREEKHAKIHQ